MGRTIPTTPEPARGADRADAAAAPAASTPDASTDATTTAPAAPIAPPDDPTTTPDASTPDADALADRLARAIAAAIDATDPVTATTPDGPAADALAAARSMGRHAVRRERVLTDALLAAIGNDPTTAPGAVAVVASIRAALAVASTPEPVDPIALAVDRVLTLAAAVASIAWADPAALTTDAAPAWARSMGDAIPTDDRDAYRLAVRDRLTAAADAIDPADPAAPIVAAAVGLASIDAPGAVPVPAWGSMRASTRGSGGSIVDYATDALPTAWDGRPTGAAVITPTAAARVAASYAAGGYGVDGAPAVPSPGALQNACHDGRVPGWRLVTRPGVDGARAAWGIIPADDPTPAGWVVPEPRERGKRDA